MRTLGFGSPAKKKTTTSPGIKIIIIYKMLKQIFKFDFSSFRQGKKPDIFCMNIKTIYKLLRCRKHTRKCHRG